MTTLECRNVSTEFGGVAVLRDVRLAVARNEFVGVCGPNGAGKTTLLNAVCGLVRIGSGQIWLNGGDVTGWSLERLAEAGVIRSFEDGSSWGRISVLDNVALGGFGAAPLSAARALADRRARQFGLADALDDRAADLSLGQRRRMELARLLVRRDILGEHVLLILDEPSRGLDHQAKSVLLELLDAHVRHQCTVLMVEHDLELARRLSSRLVTLREGRVEELGDEKQPVPGPSHSFLRSSDTPALHLDEVSAGYGREDVLRGLTLSVQFGEAVQVVGTNGSGKTTLFRVIVGALRQRRGRVTALGAQLQPGRSRLSEGIGYAPQGGRLIRDLSVQAHLDLARQAARAAGRRPEAAPAFEAAFPQVERLRRSVAGALSSGQRSLVALWVALATEPSILVADECGAGLAPDMRGKVYDFIRLNWLNENRAFLFVEHGPTPIWARAVVLERGTALTSDLGSRSQIGSPPSSGPMEDRKQ
jgi:ABC-type branched-subunit amino acid transport system ATPase component